MSKSTRKLTLDDIGTLAGVSRATVSRVINNYPHIAPEVRERVQNVIRETGYSPNKIAQSLASSTSGVIGLVIPHVANTIMTNPYFLHLINGITKATNRSDLTLALFLFHSLAEEERINETLINTNLVDGVILTADRKENPFLEKLARNNTSLAYVGKPESEASIPYVNVENEVGGYMATNYLIGKGCRRIAAIIC
ncbi:MAG: LacI family transcriptional regulator, partial [Chloroflexi bacterium]|nr:LacI family transcriptional regulator [Chloroflexota bacterium]